MYSPHLSCLCNQRNGKSTIHFAGLKIGVLTGMPFDCISKRKLRLSGWGNFGLFRARVAANEVPNTKVAKIFSCKVLLSFA
jgi:hypothetical protein